MFPTKGLSIVCVIAGLNIFFLLFVSIYFNAQHDTYNIFNYLNVVCVIAGLNNKDFFSVDQYYFDTIYF